MTTSDQPSGNLSIVVGFDGSAPAVRALDAAIRLLHGRDGRIDVVYVAHLPAIDSLSPDAIAEMEVSFNEIERDLRVQAGEQLAGREERWQFERRQGLITDELLKAAERINGAASPGDSVVIVVGSSSQAVHRMSGSVPVNLARRAHVPIVIVP